MTEYDHEEADTRITIHVKDSIEKGDDSVMVPTVDTDIVVNQFNNLIPMTFGWPLVQGNNFVITLTRYVSILEMINVYQCLHFMDVIPHCPFSEEVRNLLGSLGTAFLRLQRRSASLLSIPLNQLIFHLLIFIF